MRHEFETLRQQSLHHRLQLLTRGAWRALRNNVVEKLRGFDPTEPRDLRIRSMPCAKRMQSFNVALLNVTSSCRTVPMFIAIALP